MRVPGTRRCVPLETTALPSRKVPRTNARSSSSNRISTVSAPASSPVPVSTMVVIVHSPRAPSRNAVSGTQKPDIRIGSASTSSAVEPNARPGEAGRSIRMIRARVAGSMSGRMAEIVPSSTRPERSTVTASPNDTVRA